MSKGAGAEAGAAESGRGGAGGAGGGVGAAVPGLRTYYVAVGTPDAKLTTLMELLLALQAQASRRLSSVICCSSRDALDEVVCALLEESSFTISVLHSDLTDKEREFQVASFKRAVAQQQAEAGAGPGGQAEAVASSVQAGSAAGAAAGAGAAAAGVAATGAAGHGTGSTGPEAGAVPWPSEPSSLVLVTTDACLKGLPKEVVPLGVPLLIQYHLPKTKEVLQRRVSTVFGGGRERRGARNIAIHFVVAGEAAAFRSVEKMTLPGSIQEMPVHVADIFAA